MPASCRPTRCSRGQRRSTAPTTRRAWSGLASSTRRWSSCTAKTPGPARTVRSQLPSLPWFGLVENPRVRNQLDRARLALQQLEAGLNFYGYNDDAVPTLRYGTLVGAAQRWAAGAKSAQNDYLAYLGRVEQLDLDLLAAKAQERRRGRRWRSPPSRSRSPRPASSWPRSSSPTSRSSSQRSKQEIADCQLDIQPVRGLLQRHEVERQLDGGHRQGRVGGLRPRSAPAASVTPWASGRRAAGGRGDRRLRERRPGQRHERSGASSADSPPSRCSARRRCRGWRTPPPSARGADGAHRTRRCRRPTRRCASRNAT